jgi:hypothetical protein
MKKKTFLFCLLAGVAALLASCEQSTYSRQRDQEDKLIANFISRNGFNILTEVPADDVWGEKDYLKVPGYDNFYFHLAYRGDSVRIDSISPTEADTTDLQILANDVNVLRYKRFELTENADTLSYWTTLEQAYPLEFQYLNLNTVESEGWHMAVKLMKYPNSECTIIQPSKLGFNADVNSVTPYGYIMKIKVKQ